MVAQYVKWMWNYMKQWIDYYYKQTTRSEHTDKML